MRERRRIFHRRIRILAATVWLPWAAAMSQESPASLESPLLRGFRDPPADARPSTYWLWLGGHVDRPHMERELAAFYAAGLRGVCIFDMGARGDPRAAPPAGPPFLSDHSVADIAHAVRVAGRLGMTVQLSVASSWDMGGAWVEPRHASMGLFTSQTTVRGPAEYDDVLPLPEVPAGAPRRAGGELAFQKNVAVLAFPAEKLEDGQEFDFRRDAVVDLTGRLREDGRLTWSVPAGLWTIQRFVCLNTGERLKVPSPASDGLATDHLSREATRVYLDHVIRRLQSRLGDLGSTALRQLYLASYEVRGPIWTPDLPGEFRRYRGYELTAYLPALTGKVVESSEITERFIYDYRKTLGDLVVDGYYGAATEAAHAAGIGIESEAGGPGPPTHQVPVDALRAQGTIDEIRGEFWPKRPQADTLWVVKETACAGHIYGKRRIHMEAFTSFHHWQDGPFDLKPSADRAFCEGANHFVWHTASHLPPEAGKPGWVYHAGTHLNTNIVWWPQARAFLDYLARCSFLLQQGLFVGDVCYYYGDQGYNFVPPKHVDPSLGFGFDYDVTNREVILRRMSVEDGRITLPDGMSYALLVLPEREDIDLEVLEKIERLVSDGATVVGPKPSRANGLTDYPARDEAVRKLADRLWGPCDGKTVLEHGHGRGRIVWGSSLRETLRRRGIGPDFSLTSERDDTSLDFCHRRTADADIYFVRNQRDRWEDVECRFRVTGRTPEAWDPANGRVERHYAFKALPDGTALALRLAPYGSVFVVFREATRSLPALALEPPRGPPSERASGDAPARIVEWDGRRAALEVLQPGTYRVSTDDGRAAAVDIERVATPLELNGPWRVRFEDSTARSSELEFERLISWTDHPDPAVRYHSGTARYETGFDLPRAWSSDDRRVLLDLGSLWAVGEVYVNGRALGIVWKPPFIVDVTGAVAAGANRLVVEVASTWSNRLVGDARLPPEERTTRTNVPSSGGRSWKDVPLLPSGLFGPVRLKVAQVVTIEPR